MRPIFVYRWVAIGLTLTMLRTVTSAELINPPGLRAVLANPATPSWPSNEANKNKLHSYTPPRVPSELQRRLRQLDALITDKAWNDAFVLIDDLLISDENAVYTPDRSSYSVSIPLKRHLQHQLAQFPAEGIRQYRNLYDAIAFELYQNGKESHDSDLLNQVVTDYFATSWADDAMLALGEIAFSSGEFTKARHYWQMINPLTVGPSSEPIDVALADIKPNTDLSKLAKVWRTHQRPFQETYYKNSDIPLVDLLSRLTLCSLQENDLKRAKAELLLLRSLEPNEESWIAGRDQPVAAKLLSELDRLPQAKAEENRLGPLISWQWDSVQPISQPQPRNVLNANRGIINQQLFHNARVVMNNAISPTAIPVIADNLVLISTKNQFTGWKITDGEPIPPEIIGQQATTNNNPIQSNNQNQLRAQLQGQIRININGQIVNGVNPANNNALRRNRAFSVNRPWPESLISHQGKIFYASSDFIKNRNGLAITTNLPPTRILGIDPTEDGKRFLELDLKKDFPSTTQFFAGPPVIDDDQLYVVLNSKDARNNYSIVCYSVSESRVLWKTDVGSGISNTLREQATSLKVILGSKQILLSTNCGAVIALDSAEGNLQWISQYPAVARTTYEGSVHRIDNGILFDDRFYTAPSDSNEIICLDTNTGQLIWSVLKSNLSAQLAAVTTETVLLAGDQLEAIDRITARPKYLFPEGKHSGIRGMGVGLRAGNEYFWPTRNEIRCVNIDLGTMSRPPISLSQLGTGGANLARSGNQLIVVGTNGMNIIGDQNLRMLEPSSTIPHLSNRDVISSPSMVLSANQ